jgi:hypothetical protein
MAQALGIILQYHSNKHWLSNRQRSRAYDRRERRCPSRTITNTRETRRQRKNITSTPPPRRLSTIEYNVLDASGVPLRHNPYNANNQVWFRFEQAADEEFSVAKLNIDTRRKRCASVQGLFVLPRVCRQIRADTMLLHFAGPSFAFSDRRYNYAKAMPGFLQALSAREKKAVRSIYWPLRQAREFYHCGESGKVMTPPDKAFQTEFGKLPNLERVVLRYVATDVGSARLKGSDLEEYQALIADVVVGERYRAENVFRRELAMRGMRRQLSDREGLTVECEQTKKAAF